MTEKKLTTETDHHIGRAVRRRRKLMGYTQDDLGKLAGVTHQQVQKLECALNRFTAAKLFEVSKALETPVQNFFPGVEIKPDAASAVSALRHTHPNLLEQLAALSPEDLGDVARMVVRLSRRD